MLLSSLFSSRDQDAAHLFLRARNEQLWLDKRNDSSLTEIDFMLDCPGADLIETMSLQTGNYAGMKCCSQALSKDLAATGYGITMTHFDPQSVNNNCGPISFLVASVAIQTGGLPSLIQLMHVWSSVLS